MEASPEIGKYWFGSTSAKNCCVLILFESKAPVSNTPSPMVPFTNPAARPSALQNEPLAGSLPQCCRLSSNPVLTAAGAFGSEATCCELTPASMMPIAIIGRSSGTNVTLPCTRTAPLETRINAWPTVAGARRSSLAVPLEIAISKPAACLPEGVCRRPMLLSIRTRVIAVTGCPWESCRVTTRCIAECPSAGSVASEACRCIRSPIGRPLDCRHKPSSAATGRSLLRLLRIPPAISRKATVSPPVCAWPMGTVAFSGGTASVASSAASAVAGTPSTRMLRPIQRLRSAVFTADSLRCPALRRRAWIRSRRPDALCQPGARATAPGCGGVAPRPP